MQGGWIKKYVRCDIGGGGGHYSLGDPSAGGVVGVRWRMRGPAIMLLGLTSPCPGAMVAPLALTASVELSLDVWFFLVRFLGGMVDQGGDGIGSGGTVERIRNIQFEVVKIEPLLSRELDQEGFAAFLGLPQTSVTRQ